MNNLLKKYFLILILITTNIFPKCNCSCCCKKKPEILSNNNFSLQEKQQKEKEKQKRERLQKLEKEKQQKEEEERIQKEEEERIQKEEEERIQKEEEEKREKEEEERIQKEEEEKREKEEEERRQREKEEEEKREKEDEEKRQREKEEEERKQKEEEENKKYLESLLKSIKKVKILKDAFFTEKKYIYVKCGNLGEGSFGAVYKIQKINNGKFFAFKKIIVEDNNGLKEIQKEIQNMILLRNEKNIVKIFDVYKLNGKSIVTFYIIMEFCENGDLDGFIKNKKIPDKKNLMDKIAYQIINAVHSCYKEKIVHRDLKPLNIFLDKDWNVKLGDFGISDNFKYDGKDSSRVGSLRYMCYEKIQRKEHNPFKADLYSLGVILYELYTEISYSKDEHKPHSKSYKEGFYTNENVERKLNKNLADEKYINLKTLLQGLLKQSEKNRWGWDEILKSEFYKELDKKYKEK